MIQLRMHDGRARPGRLRPAPPGREAPVGAGDEGPRRPQPADGLRRPRLARLLLRARLPPDRGVVRPRRRQAQLAAHDAGDRHRRRSRRGSRGRACGATRARGSAASTSPARAGPSAHASWTNPDGALATAWEPQRKDAIAAPAVVITRDRGRMRVDFDFTRQPGPAGGLAAGHGQLERRGGRATAHLHLPDRADPPRHAGHRGAARPRQALRHLREHDRAATRRSPRSRSSPSSTRRARRRSCRSPSSSWASSAAWWPASAASSGAEDPLAPAAPRAQVRMHGLWALRGLGQPRQPRREARARR